MPATATSPARSRSHRGRGHGAAGRRVLAALPVPSGGGVLAATELAHPYQALPGAGQCTHCWGWVDDYRHLNIRLG